MQETLVGRTGPPPGATELGTWRILFCLHPNPPLIEKAPVRHRIATIRFTDLPLLAVLIVADKQARALVPRFLRMVPGFNDSDDELKRLAEFLVSVSPDIPWHVTAFHKDYKNDRSRKHHPANIGQGCQDWQEGWSLLCACGEFARPGR